MFKTLLSGLKREIVFLFKKRKLLIFYSAVFPFIIFFLILSIFSARVITGIPIAVVDNDKSSLSAEFTRALNAGPQLSVEYYPQDLTAARALLENGKVFAVVLLDKDYEKNILHLKGGTAVLYVNNQYLMVGSAVYKTVMTAAETLSVKYKVKSLASFNVPMYAVGPNVMPVITSENILYNPDLNYIFILVLGLIPAVIQLFAGMAIIYSFLYEIKHGRYKDMLNLNKKEFYLFSLGKMLVYLFIYFVVFMVMMWILRYFFALPLRGGFLLIAGGAAAFLLFTFAVSLLISGMAGRLTFGLSSGAVYSAPAFAYFGVTFPVQAMPLLGRVWAECLPGTHLNRILVNESLRGGSALYSVSEILIMTAAGAVLFALGMYFYKKRVFK